MVKIDLDPLDSSFKNNLNKPVHRWYRFHAGCSSEFPERIFEFLHVRSGQLVLDPFCGSGTILLCAKEKGIDSIGIDINQFYVFMSQVKTFWDFDLDALCLQIRHLGEDLDESLKHVSDRMVTNVPEYIMRYFFPNVLNKLSIIKERVLDVHDRHIRDLLLLALSSTLIEVSKVHHVGETIVFDANPKARPSVLRIYLRNVSIMYSDLRIKMNLKNSGRASVYLGDVSGMDRLVTDSEIDHVITHPPYLNNYNYLLHDRLPLYFLEFLKKPSDEQHLRESIIGNVTGKPSEQLFLGFDDVLRVAAKVKKAGDVARYRTVLEYFDTMTHFLTMIHNKLRRNGYCALLVGNSYFRGVMIPLDRLISQVAKRIGFGNIETFKVRDRGKGAFQHLYNGKLYDSVVLLKRI